MRVMGIRCLPEGFYYIVLEGTQQSPIPVERQFITFPVGMGRCEQLAWFRKQIIEILNKWEIEATAIKPTEPGAKNKNLKRVEAEGVVKEAIYSTINQESGVRIKIQLKRDIAGFHGKAKYIHLVLKDRGLADIKITELKDAAVAAIAELPEEGDNYA